MSTADSSSTPIDWAAVHARLERSAAALRGTLAPDLAEQDATLARRARAIAGAPAAAPAACDILEVVAFQLAGQSLAIGATHVRETVAVREITALPGLPPRVTGLANVRSRVVAVFDLRPVLQVPAGGLPANPKLVLVSVAGDEFALLAEEIIGAQSIRLGTFRRDIPGLNREFVQAVTPDGLVLLDATPLRAALATDDAPTP